MEGLGGGEVRKMWHRSLERHEGAPRARFFEAQTFIHLPCWMVYEGAAGNCAELAVGGLADDEAQRIQAMTATVDVWMKLQRVYVELVGERLDGQESDSSFRATDQEVVLVPIVLPKPLDVPRQ